jgi:FkbM family methyltransferase
MDARRVLRTILLTAKTAFRAVWNICDKKSGYAVISPPSARPQLVYSKKARSLLRYQVRSDSDHAVVKHIFRHETYRFDWGRAQELVKLYHDMVAAGLTPLILDLGANIGCSTTYFAAAFPKAQVVGVEPHDGNYRLAAANCRSPLIEMLHAGIAATAGRATIVNPDHGPQSYRTQTCSDGAIEMITVDGILRQHPDAVPLMIKIDIEGFERDLFAQNTEWVAKFPLLIIELHDRQNPGAAVSRNFLKVISALDRDFLYRGENVYSFANPLAAGAVPAARVSAETA